MTQPATHIWRLLKWGRTLARHGALRGIERDLNTPPPVRRLTRIARSTPTSSISWLMSATVTSAPRAARRKAMSPVPPAMSSTASPGCGFTRRTNRSFHSRCRPTDIASFITSYFAATLENTAPTRRVFSSASTVS